MIWLWYILKSLAWLEILLLCCIAVGALADYMPDKLSRRLIEILGGGKTDVTEDEDDTRGRS